MATGSLAIAGVWDAWTATFALLAAAILPLLLLRLVLWLGVPRWSAAAVLTLLLVLTAYLMTASTDGTLVESLADAVPRLLTEPLPYVSRPDLLAAPVVLVALVSLLAGLRLDARARVGPVAGALVLYLAGALLSAGETRPARAARDAAGRPGPGRLDHARPPTGRRPAPGRDRAARGRRASPCSSPPSRWCRSAAPTSPATTSTLRCSASRRRARSRGWAPGPPTRTPS